VEDTDIQHIKSVLKEWNKFPAHAEADFNCLFNEVSTALQEGLTGGDLVFVIQNEFMNHFGEEGPAEDVAHIAGVISDWWLSKQSS
jgi:hypothetical protein